MNACQGTQPQKGVMTFVQGQMLPNVMGTMMIYESTFVDFDNPLRPTPEMALMAAMMGAEPMCLDYKVLRLACGLS